MITRNKVRFSALTLATTVGIGSLGFVGAVAPASAQHSFLHRHHKAAGLAAGYAAYRAAKVTGRNRAARGRHRNFAQRHPYLSGIAAGMATNHFAKKHR